jgi:DNA polymerase
MNPSALSSIISDFVQYLQQIKDEPVVIEISGATWDMIDQWGQSRSGMRFAFQGPEQAAVFIVDSGSGFFKGDSGKLLTKILGAMKLTPDAVFICNAAGRKAVSEKIGQVRPKVIIALGQEAARMVLDSDQPIERLRGSFQTVGGIRVMPTFHPAFLLEVPDRKKEVWADMQQVMALLESSYAV